MVLLLILISNQTIRVLLLSYLFICGLYLGYSSALWDYIPSNIEVIAMELQCVII